MQALFPSFAILRYDAMCAALASIALFSLHHALPVRLIRELERGIILRSVLLERHIDRNLTLWKLEIMQISGHYIRCTLHAHLNTELNAPLAASSFSCFICSLYLCIYLTHNAYIIGTFRGSGNTFLRLFSLYFHFTLMRLIGIVEVAVSKF